MHGRGNPGPPGFRQQERQPFGNQPGAQGLRNPVEQRSVASPAESRNPLSNPERHSGSASSRPRAASPQRERREDRSGGPEDEISARLETLERHVRANKAKTAIESEMKRMASSINPVTDRGLLLQHEMYAAIYSAEKNQKSGIALAGDFGVFMRARCRRLGYMAEDISTYAQQKVADLGEDATEAEIAEVDRKILRFYQDKKVKAEDVLAKHPEWLCDNR